ncbi:hypothetical protein EZV62_026786 [Acer yangbiense]|uniref:Uncharacterized protein n=1 Tax=Acer yangbiense TaxID=1000413 RepID=A0A5C7GT46_9ROSI|nr:hypothetical protein EZV62_026786 [Acer yangbiense]
MGHKTSMNKSPSLASSPNNLISLLKFLPSLSSSGLSQPALNWENEAILGTLILGYLLKDQIINARLMGGDLKVGVEVEKGEEDGQFTSEGVCRAVKTAMDENSEVGKLVKESHAVQREFLLSKGLESCYIDGFVQNLHDLLKP